MEPEGFTVRPSDAEKAIYGDAIKFGYVRMDKLIAEIMELVGPRDLVVFATGLSQQAFFRKEDSGGQLFYRPRDISAFLDFAGVANVRVEPVMTHQFRLRFDAADEMQSAIRLLESLRVDGTPLSGISNLAEDGFVFGCSISNRLSPKAMIARQSSNEAVPFFDLFYQIDGMKSGCHHPDGILWIRTGEAKDAGRCSILDIFPTIMEALGRPDLVPADRLGRSLLGMGNRANLAGRGLDISQRDATAAVPLHHQQRTCGLWAASSQGRLDPRLGYPACR
jgi:hypothetical protein